MTGKTKATFVLLLSIPLLLGAVASSDQNAPNDKSASVTANPPTYAVNWHSINGGGTSNSSSPNFETAANAGQPIAGSASSQSYDMGVGFWGGGPADCPCPCKYDPQCDGITSNLQDVVHTVNVAFRGAAGMIDAGCPRERTDMDANGSTSVTDVVRVVNVAFRGQTVAANYVDPCL